MKQPTHHLLDINNTTLSAYEWCPELRDKSATLVLVHATGFHARCWDQVIALLPDQHIIALDQRSHGLSSNGEFSNWLTFAEDIVFVLDYFEITQAYGIGHSMGGHCCTMASALAPHLFARLLLLDPVILSPENYKQHAKAELPPVSEHPVSRRRNHFESIEDAIDRYQSRPPFNVFTPQALQDYFNFGLHKAEKGQGVELACPPAIEAKIYQTVFTNQAIVEAIHQVDIPVTIVRAMQAQSHAQMMSDFRYSPTWTKLAESFSRGKDVLLSDLTHFMPMQAPDVVARLIQEQRPD